jgi:hypothetical protein
MECDPYWLQFYSPIWHERFALWTQYVIEMRDQGRLDEGPDPLVGEAWEKMGRITLHE